MSTEPKSLLPEIPVNPGAPITAVRGLVSSLNLGEEHLILLAPSADRPLTPGIESTPRDRHHSTHQHNRLTCLLRLDEGISHRDSLAKKAAAFFRISHSIRSRSTSR
jgi:hypothetical protein